MGIKAKVFNTKFVLKTYSNVKQNQKNNEKY